jgi:hypothetical protein
MAWYVFALVDAIPAGESGKGLTGALSIRKLAGAFIVVERRADVPPIEFGSLKKHQDVVSRLSTRVPAILPVRFGTLLEPDHLEEALQDRDQEIAEAFDAVRDRVQFTWRVAGKAKKGGRKEEAGGSTLEAGGGKLAAGSRRPEVGDVKDERRAELPKSGADYLRQAAQAANPAPPAAFRPLRATVAPLAVVERYQPATVGLPEAVYHLVDNEKVIRYVQAATAVQASSPGLVLSGPWPPFAFAPEIL